MWWCITVFSINFVHINEKILTAHPSISQNIAYLSPCFQIVLISYEISGICPFSTNLKHTSEMLRTITHFPTFYLLNPLLMSWYVVNRPCDSFFCLWGALNCPSELILVICLYWLLCYFHKHNWSSWNFLCSFNSIYLLNQRTQPWSLFFVQLVLMVQRLVCRDWRSGGPQFKSHPRLFSIMIKSPVKSTGK